MSASTELLLEEIREQEAKILSAKEATLPVSTIAALELHLSKLKRQLSSASEALTEVKHLLKS